VIAVQHYFESRDFRPGEVTQLDFERIDDDTYVVKLCEYGPRGPLGYVIAVYDGEGRRKGLGAWRGDDHDRAVEMFDGVCENVRRRSREQRRAG
jgi:hypothetical protein